MILNKKGHKKQLELGNLNVVIHNAHRNKPFPFHVWYLPPKEGKSWLLLGEKWQ